MDIKTEKIYRKLENNFKIIHDTEDYPISDNNIIASATEHIIKLLDELYKLDELKAENMRDELYNILIYLQKNKRRNYMRVLNNLTKEMQKYWYVNYEI